MKYVCLYFSDIYFVFTLLACCLSAHDTALQKLADHVRRVLTEVKKWKHYLADKLTDLSKVNPNALKPEHRGFDLDHELCGLDQGSCTDP